MKKIILFFALLLTVYVSSAQKTWFVGGTASIGYVNDFTFSFEPQFGYEFTERWAIGSGIGLALNSSLGYTFVLGVAEPYVRFCAWHNDRVFIDLKATAGFAFDNELELCQVGIRPSLRFRINDHWDMAADLGLFGAQYTMGNDWTPAIGISATSVGLWFNYRF